MRRDRCGSWRVIQSVGSWKSLPSWDWEDGVQGSWSNESENTCFLNCCSVLAPPTRVSSYIRLNCAKIHHSLWWYRYEADPNVHNHHSSVQTTTSQDIDQLTKVVYIYFAALVSKWHHNIYIVWRVQTLWHRRSTDSTNNHFQVSLTSEVHLNSGINVNGEYIVVNSLCTLFYKG